MKRRRIGIDVDTALVFFLLAVTVSQMGHYLASYAVGWMQALGYLQAVAVDCAIWRSAWWYRKDRSAKRRRVSLFGVLAFSAISAWYNYGYYSLRAPMLPGWHRALMATVLPAGVALLSYLAAQHERIERVADVAEGTTNVQNATPNTTATIEHVYADAPTMLQCSVCGWQRRVSNYATERGAQNALAGHMRAHRSNGHE